MLIGRPRPKGRRHDDICLRVSCSRLGGGHALVTLVFAAVSKSKRESRGMYIYIYIYLFKYIYMI